jgi:hypothetical protein
MAPVECILKDYRNAGEEHRLDLFLSYRDLRDRFRDIEREEASAGSLRESPAADDLTIRCLRRFLPALVRCC